MSAFMPIAFLWFQCSGSVFNGISLPTGVFCAFTWFGPIFPSSSKLFLVFATHCYIGTSIIFSCLVVRCFVLIKWGAASTFGTCEFIIFNSHFLWGFLDVFCSFLFLCVCASVHSDIIHSAKVLISTGASQQIIKNICINQGTLE